MSYAEKLQDIVDQFTTYDENGDGKITVEELQKNMPDKEYEEIVNLMKLMDKDDSGAVDIIEFAQMLGGIPLKEKQLDLKPTQEQIDSTKKLFGTLDADNNGYVKFSEFHEHLFNEGIGMDIGRSRQLFRIIQSKGKPDEILTDGITYQNLLNYVVEDDYALQNKDKGDARYDAITDIEGLLKVAAVEGFEISQETLMDVLTAKDSKDAIQEILARQAQQKSMDDVEDQERDKWQGFINFRRRVNNKTLMKSPNKYKDILPGKHDLKKIVQFDDLPPLEPVHVVVKGAKWIEGKGGKPGKLILPDSFDGKIPIDIATNEVLNYYGVSIAEASRGNKNDILLQDRHIITDFTYSDDYYESWVLGQVGGPGLEYHRFHHLDTCLSQNSGHWVVAKWADDAKTELHITAFKIPIRHTVYTPGGVIHTNSFLKGTWRTMLSDGPINEAKLVRSDDSMAELQIGTS